MTSTSQNTNNSLHVAIIMDGNGRWAAARGWPRLAGHRAGAEAVRRVVEAAPRLGIGTLTLYAFSADNWKRPSTEIHGLFQLFERHLRSETEKCVENGIRVSVLGRRDRLPRKLVRMVESCEAATAAGVNLHLRLAVDYSARDSILRAAERLPGGRPATRDVFARLLAEVDHCAAPAPEVDLLIRTSGEQRLSDFLLWECAYAELYFTPKLWPDFDEHDLVAAIDEFRRRERRFGALPEPLVAAAV
jgi:undecaprenyl diphosphate synthase